MMIDSLLILLSLYVIWDIALLFQLSFKFKSYDKLDHDPLPMVSILLAVRNEEAYLCSCLEHLVALDYPKDKIEILIGDDFSTDNSGEIIEEYAAKYARIKRVNIVKAYHGLIGKSKVVAQLAKASKGEWLLFTDADAEVPKSWVYGLLDGVVEKQIALVVGVTKVKTTSNYFSVFQSMDWLVALSMIKMSHDMGIPITGLGNNMMVRSRTYFEIGGYENQHPSIVEDQQLVKAITSIGGKLTHVYKGKIIVDTAAEKTLDDLFQQRKRWMVGAFNIPLLQVLVLLINAFRLPVMIAGFVYFPSVFIIGLMIIILIKARYLRTIKNMINWKPKDKYGFLSYIFYEGYLMLLNFSLLWYYIFPQKIEWKGRQYDKLS